MKKETIPKGQRDITVEFGGHTLKAHQPRQALLARARDHERDLLNYYAGVASALLPHLTDRAMVMKRYPNGAHGDFFFMKRAPTPRPDWIETCRVPHGVGNVIDFPIVQDLASLLWLSIWDASISIPGTRGATTRTGPTISTSIWIHARRRLRPGDRDRAPGGAGFQRSPASPRGRGRCRSGNLRCHRPFQLVPVTGVETVARGLGADGIDGQRASLPTRSWL